MTNPLRLGRLAGVQILIDWSLLIIFGLILLSLGAGLLPAWHPDWSAGLRWGVAFASAVLFFGSVLLHELAHALVGRALGAQVPRITLFVFGGMSHLEREPTGWRGELWMALVGPLTSLALGLACLLAVGALAGPLDPAQGDARATLADLPPLATLLLWLGQINILLGLFNLVPGYPLDGGRVLRAILWGLTGDQAAATRRAAGLGQLFAWLLIAAGIAMMLGLRVPVFGSGVLPGLWIAFIGWFLNNAAIMSYRQQVVSRSLAPVAVERLMLATLDPVDPETPLDRLVEEGVLHSGRRAFPVVRAHVLLGLVTLEDLRRVPASERPRRRVAEVMTPRERLVTVERRDSAEEALRRLSQAQVNQLPVLDGGRLVGLLTRENLLKWLALEGVGGVADAADGGRR